MFRAIYPHMRQVTAERHVAVRLKQPRKMIRRNLELMRDGVAGDFVLIAALEKNAYLLEQRKRPAGGPRDRLPQ